MREAVLLVLVVFLSIISLLLGVSIGMLTQSKEALASEGIEANEDFLSYDTDEKIYLSSFDEILNKVSEERYDVKDYNCKNFSQELKENLADEGYYAKVCYGSLRKCEGVLCGHAWVKVEDLYIEATTGKIISPSEYTEGYNEKSCS